MADELDLPVDPIKDSPKKACECGCTEFEPETDVMDTWATSSLTPQIAADMLTSKGLDDSFVPFNLRPNAHDNIRVWDFYTIVKSLYHFNKLPWTDLMISGYVTSSDGSKLAKSKNNSANTPQEIIKNYSADVTRYWAGNMALGKDTAFSLVEFDNGKKLVNKLWNASKFVLSFLENYTPKKVKLETMDAWLIEKYKNLYNSFVKHLDGYEISLALGELERFFWDFCDNYVELVKRRLYNPDIFGERECESAKYTCYHVLLGMLKMFAPFMPHITEEIYQSYYAQIENKASIHISGYLFLGKDVDKSVLEKGEEVLDIVSAVRQFKSENKLSLKTEVEDITISSKNTDFIEKTISDLKGVAGAKKVILVSGEFNVKVGKIIETNE